MDRQILFETEQVLVNMAMMSREACFTLDSRYHIWPDKMSDPRNALVFAVVHIMHSDKMKVDIKSVTDYLQSGNNLEKAGGAAYVAELGDQIASTANLDFYAKRFVKLWRQGEAEKLSVEFREKVQSSPDSTRGAISELMEKLRIIEGEDTTTSILSADTLRDTLSSDLEFNIAHKNQMVGVPCGIDVIDEITRGFRPGELVTLAAVSGGGKSAMADYWMFNMVARNYRVGFFSLEMAREQVLERLASLSTGVSLKKIRSGDITQAEKKKMEQMKFLDGSFFLADTPLMDIDELKASMRQLTFVNKIDIAFIDYAQLVRADANGRKGYEVLSDIADGLKAMAKELSIPVVALSQINSRGYDDTPEIGDLGGGLAFTKASDYIFLLYRDTRFDGNSPEGNTRRFLNMAKGRQTGGMAVRLRFLPDTLSFKYIPPEEDPPPEEWKKKEQKKNDSKTD